MKLKRLLPFLLLVQMLNMTASVPDASKDEKQKSETSQAQPMTLSKVLYCYDREFDGCSCSALYVFGRKNVVPGNTIWDYSWNAGGRDGKKTGDASLTILRRDELPMLNKNLYPVVGINFPYSLKLKHLQRKVLASALYAPEIQTTAQEEHAIDTFNSKASDAHERQVAMGKMIRSRVLEPNRLDPEKTIADLVKTNKLKEQGGDYFVLDCTSIANEAEINKPLKRVTVQVKDFKPDVKLSDSFHVSTPIKDVAEVLGVSFLFNNDFVGKLDLHSMLEKNPEILAKYAGEKNAKAFHDKNIGDIAIGKRGLVQGGHYNWRNGLMLAAYLKATEDPDLIRQKIQDENFDTSLLQDRLDPEKTLEQLLEEKVIAESRYDRDKIELVGLYHKPVKPVPPCAVVVAAAAKAIDSSKIASGVTAAKK